MNNNVDISTTRVIETELIRIEISEDGLAAYATIKHFALPIPKIAQEFKNLLLKSNLTFGLIPENIRKLIKDGNPTQSLQIARGIPPVNGIKGAIKLLVNFSQRPEYDIEKQNFTSYEALKHPNLVFEGTPLLEITPPRPSRNGKSVTGDPILPAVAVPPEPIQLTLGENVAYSSENPNVIVATGDGLATFENNRVSVIACRVFKGDVSGVMGPIIETRPVIVLGDAKAGTSIESEQNIEIYGTIEDVMFVSQGDIIVHQGYVGRGKGYLKAAGNVLLAFALNQQIEAGGSVYFISELIGCNVKAGKQIISPTGGIIGGEVEALFGIRIFFAGSDEAVVTRLTVGRPAQLLEKKRELDQLIETHQKMMKENKQLLYDLVMKQLNNNLSDSELEHLIALQEAKKMLPEKINALEHQLTELNNMVSRLENASIQINGIIHEKVILTINDEKFVITDKTRRKEYRLHRGNITAFPL
jgi:hypothetical protein